MIMTHFTTVEKITLVNPQHAAERTSHLSFAKISPYKRAQSENPEHYRKMLGYRNHLLDEIAWDKSGDLHGRRPLSMV